jgi:hypothetical protein
LCVLFVCLACLFVWLDLFIYLACLFVLFVCLLGLAGLGWAVLGCARWARGAAWLGSLGGWLG